MMAKRKIGERITESNWVKENNRNIAYKRDDLIILGNFLKGFFCTHYLFV